MTYASRVTRTELHRRSQMANRSPKNQRGMSFLTILIITMVVVFLSMFAFKVGPHYMEYMTVKNIAEDAAANPDLMRSKSKMNEYLIRAYRTNSLWELTPKETITMVKDGKKGMVLTVNYEKRANLLYNIDLVTRFNTPVGTGNQ
ncbi:MAG: DUF4845 domain-containing protein [Granulosicoccus sp.]|nr:DUF4845 domain-containing protein [Granulosicoccus sp.]